MNKSFRDRRWVMVEKPPFLDYPKKQVFLPDGEHWVYENDLSQPPKKIARAPEFFEDNGDGTYTSWGYTVWGPVGNSGKFKGGVQPVVVAKKFLKDLETHIKLLERAMVSQGALVETMRFQANVASSLVVK